MGMLLFFQDCKTTWKKVWQKEAREHALQSVLGEGFTSAHEIANRHSLAIFHLKRGIDRNFGSGDAIGSHIKIADKIPEKIVVC